jgi:hypothetical protein
MNVEHRRVVERDSRLPSAPRKSGGEPLTQAAALATGRPSTRHGPATR